MTYTFKLARRLATSRAVLGTVALVLAACGGGDATGPTASGAPTTANPGASQPTTATLALTPANPNIAINQTVQFAAFARNAGDSVPVAVDWTASGGTISPSGVFSSAAPGTFVVVGKSRAGAQADTAEVVVSDSRSGGSAGTPTPPPAGSGARAWVTENFASYSSIDQFLREPQWGEPSNPGQMVFDAAQGFGGSPHALRYDFPKGDPARGGCNDFSVGRTLSLPSAQREVWVEFYVKFQQGWHTQAPSAWGCTRAADHKLLRGLVWGAPNTPYFSLKDGHFGHAWVSSGPDPKHWDQNAGDARPYWNGQWIRMRVHWKVGQAPNYGVVEVWANDQVIDRYTTLDTPATGIYALRIGANMNNLVEAPQSMWWGQIKVWNTNPGW